jgi:hypothetical protein
MTIVEVQSKLSSFDEIRDNFSKLGVWLEDKETNIEKAFFREKYGYKQFKIFLEEEQGNKIILIKKEINSENDRPFAINSCNDLLNFLVQNTFMV